MSCSLTCLWSRLGTLLLPCVCTGAGYSFRPHPGLGSTQESQRASHRAACAPVPMSSPGVAVAAWARLGRRGDSVQEAQNTRAPIVVRRRCPRPRQESSSLDLTSSQLRGMDWPRSGSGRSGGILLSCPFPLVCPLPWFTCVTGSWCLHFRAWLLPLR